MAKREGKAVEEIAAAILVQAVGEDLTPKRDLNFMGMSEADAREIEEAHQDFENIDPEAWK